MSEIIVVLCPAGFSDQKILSQGVRPGGIVEVSPDQFRQMQQSGIHVEAQEHRLELNPGALARMQGTEENTVEWSPIGWYAAQLARGVEEKEE